MSERTFGPTFRHQESPKALVRSFVRSLVRSVGVSLASSGQSVPHLTRSSLPSGRLSIRPKDCEELTDGHLLAPFVRPSVRRWLALRNALRVIASSSQ